MQPLSGNQRPDQLTSLMNLAREMHLCRSSSNVPRLPSFLERLQNPHDLLTLRKCTIPCACRAKRHLNVQKWSGAEVFCKYWLRNVLRATTACTNAEVFCTFWLRHVLRATSACTFSTSQLLKVLQCWSVLYILTWKCASRHKGVHFFDTSNEDGLFLRGRPLAPKRSMPGHWYAGEPDRSLDQTSNGKFRQRTKANLLGTIASAFAILLSRGTRKRTVTTEVSSTADSSDQRRAGSQKMQRLCSRRSCAHGWQSEATDGPKGGRGLVSSLSLSFSLSLYFSLFVSLSVSFSLFLWLSTYLPTYLPMYLSIDLSIYRSISLFLLSDLLSSTFLFSLTLPISAFHLSILSEVWLRNFLRLYPFRIIYNPAISRFFMVIVQTSCQQLPGWSRVWHGRRLPAQRHLLGIGSTFGEMRCKLR